jgi:hypothetical protein
MFKKPIPGGCCRRQNMKGLEKLKRCLIFSVAGRQNSREKKNHRVERERKRERGRGEQIGFSL